MKIIIHETHIAVGDTDHGGPNNYHIVRMKAKTTGYVYLILFLCMFLPTGSLYAQPGSTANKVKIDSPKKEAENLNVFQQWIKWNNPGSMAINHLTRQAENYYNIRDQQIAKLKTKSDWQKRQQVVKNKLKEIIGPFPKKE